MITEGSGQGRVSLLLSATLHLGHGVPQGDRERGDGVGAGPYGCRPSIGHRAPEAVQGPNGQGPMSGLSLCGSRHAPEPVQGPKAMQAPSSTLLSIARWKVARSMPGLVSWSEPMSAPSVAPATVVGHNR